MTDKYTNILAQKKGGRSFSKQDTERITRTQYLESLKEFSSFVIDFMEESI
jgi:hypothetical protein